MSNKRMMFVGDIKAIDEKEMSLTAAISTNTVDRMGEVLDPRGVDISNYKKNPIVLWAHDYSQLPIGKALWVKRDGETIVSKVKFASHAFAQEVFQLYKEGFMKAFSVGFVPKEWEDGDGKKKPYRTFTKWELLEYSAVPVPANPDAVALALQKGIIKDEALKKALETSYSDEEVLWDGKDIKEEIIADNHQANQTKALEELIAENGLLNEKISQLEKENGELRLKLYKVLSVNKDSPSEITVDDLEAKALEVIDGVIRRHTGKVS